MIADDPTLIIPIRSDDHGVLRISDSGIPLEVVIHAYLTGETPEGIVESYPRLTTADVYAVIGYYLTNRNELDVYVRQRDWRAEQILLELESNLSPEARALRTRLRAYQERQQDRK